MRNLLLLGFVASFAACGGGAPTVPPSPSEEAANIAGKLNVLATKCPKYVGSISELKAVQQAIAKHEEISLKLGGTQDTIKQARRAMLGANAGGVAWHGQEEECVELANEVARYL